MTLTKRSPRLGYLIEEDNAFAIIRMSTKCTFIVYDYARARFMDKQWALRTLR